MFGGTPAGRLRPGLTRYPYVSRGYVLPMESVPQSNGPARLVSSSSGAVGVYPHPAREDPRDLPRSYAGHHHHNQASQSQPPSLGIEPLAPPKRETHRVVMPFQREDYISLLRQPYLLSDVRRHRCGVA